MSGQSHLILSKDELKRFHSLTTDCFRMFRNAVESGFENHGQEVDDLISKYDTENNEPERCILVGYMQALLTLGSGGIKNA